MNFVVSSNMTSTTSTSTATIDMPSLTSQSLSSCFPSKDSWNEPALDLTKVGPLHNMDRKALSALQDNMIQEIHIRLRKRREEVKEKFRATDLSCCDSQFIKLVKQMKVIFRQIQFKQVRRLFPSASSQQQH